MVRRAASEGWAGPGPGHCAMAGLLAVEGGTAGVNTAAQPAAAGRVGVCPLPPGLVVPGAGRFSHSMQRTGTPCSGAAPPSCDNPCAGASPSPSQQQAMAEPSTTHPAAQQGASHNMDTDCARRSARAPRIERAFTSPPMPALGLGEVLHEHIQLTQSGIYTLPRNLSSAFFARARPTSPGAAGCGSPLPSGRPR